MKIVNSIMPMSDVEALAANGQKIKSIGNKDFRAR